MTSSGVSAYALLQLQILILKNAMIVSTIKYVIFFANVITFFSMFQYYELNMPVIVTMISNIFVIPKTNTAPII